MKNLRSNLDALRAAAVEIDGQRWVRACVAVKLLLASNSAYYSRFARSHGIPEMRVCSQRRWRCPHGVTVYWQLAAVVRVAEDNTIRTLWTKRQKQRLVSLLLTHTTQEIAAKLGRTHASVLTFINRNGGIRGLMRSRHNLITSGELLRLLRKTARGTLTNWHAAGMPCVVLPSARGDKLFDLRQVRTWLTDQPNLLVTLHPASRQLLRLTSEHLEGRAA